PPSLMGVDAPNREVGTARRAVTSAPLQALVLLNDPTYVEAARVFAERILREGGPSQESRLAFAFRSALARPPTAEERRILLNVREQALARFRGDAAAARKLLAVGESPRDGSFDATE